MHPYSTKRPANPKFIAMLAIVSRAVSAGIGAVAKQIHDDWGWTIGGASALSCFGALYFVFDRFLWRLRVARALLLLPDLNGAWECHGRTTLHHGVAQDLPWRGTTPEHANTRRSSPKPICRPPSRGEPLDLTPP